MRKRKDYKRAWFAPDVLASAIEIYRKHAGDDVPPGDMIVSVGEERWTHENYQEFLDDYRKSVSPNFELEFRSQESKLVLDLSGTSYGTTVGVRAPSRSMIGEIFSVFEDAYGDSVQPLPPTPAVKPRVFIGHGGNAAWRDLKDHLQDKHRYEVVAYETGGRAGHAIRDVLEQMTSQSSIAFLVYTAEDEQADGKFRARQNVVHETGLFQGALGFNRAITILQDGVETFSNLQGIDQLRYKSSIKEVFGDVLATLRREFGE